MPLIRATNKAGDGAQYVLNSGEDFLVGAGVTVQSNNALSVFVTSPGAHVMRIEGTISGYQGALLCGVQNVDGPAYIHIGKTGVLASRLDVVNGYGIGLQAGGSVLENYGVISGYNALSLNAAGPTSFYFKSIIANFGTINAVGAAIYRPDGIGANEDVDIFNSGKILGGQFVLDFSGVGGRARFVNTGIAQGDIVFGSLTGFYDGSRGILLAAPGSSGPARIFATGGSIYVAPGLSPEVFDFANTGGSSLNFENSPTGVRFALDGSLTRAGAVTAGDSYLNLDRVATLIGSRQGDDWLRGDPQDGSMGGGGLAGEAIRGLGGKDRLEGLAGKDVLYGGDDRDTLAGGDGNDRLDGGRGRDVIFGGAGQDIFNFSKEGGIGDQLSDFTAADDVISLFMPLFGAARGAPARYVTADEFRLTSGHHRAGDRSDRFIYDTKKTELWFDPDGTGRKKAIMIADLQPGAVLTAGDLELYY